MDQNIFARVDDYISGLLAPADDALTYCLQTSNQGGLPEISITANQGKLLHILALTCGAKRILELGTLGGYSTIWLARALPADGKMLTLEYDPHHAEVARGNIVYAGLENKVEVAVGRALDILPQLVAAQDAPFDFIFIDADKPPYKEYFEYALQLSRPGTLIICDNVIRDGEVLNENSTDERVQGVQRLNQFLSECPQVTATIMQTVGVKEYDGMAIAVVR